MNRTRTRGQLAPETVLGNWRKWGTCSETSSTLNSTVLGVRLGKTESMTDVVVPRFHRAVEDGSIFMNPCSRTVEDVATSNGRGLHATRIGAPISCSGVNRYTEWDYPDDQLQRIVRLGFTAGGTDIFPHSGGIISATDIASAIKEASTRASSSVGQSKADLWQDVAETKKSLSMLRDITTLAHGVLSKTPLGRLSDASSAWLLYRFGMRPIVEDLHVAMKSLQVAIERKRVTSRGLVRISRYDNTTVSVNHSPFVTIVQKQVNDEVLVRATSLEETVISRIHEAGFTTKQLLKLPWELIPNSYVADYFFNIGEMIGAILPAPGYNHLGSCLSVKRNIQTVYGAIGSSASDLTYRIDSPTTGTLFGAKQTYTRTPGLGRIGLVVKSDFHLDDPGRLADIFARIAQRIDPRTRRISRTRRLNPDRGYRGDWAAVLGGR